MAQRPAPALFGVLAGALLLNLGPIGGLLTTIVWINRAFRAVDTVDPSLKARVLAQGINDAMNCLAAGAGVWFVGLVIAIASLAFMLRAERRATQ